jgi:hypothetical protein
MFNEDWIFGFYSAHFSPNHMPVDSEATAESRALRDFPEITSGRSFKSHIARRPGAGTSSNGSTPSLICTHVADSFPFDLAQGFGPLRSGLGSRLR